MKLKSFYKAYSCLDNSEAEEIDWVAIILRNIPYDANENSIRINCSKNGVQITELLGPKKIKGKLLV